MWYNLSTLPWVLILFYVVLPLAVRMWRGSFWANVYITVSSALGALYFSALPLWLAGRIPGEPSIPGVEPLVEHLKSLVGWIPAPLFAGVAFIALFLLQKGVVRLADLTGW